MVAVSAHDLLRFEPGDPARSPGADLVEAMVAEVSAIHGRIDGAGRPSATPADLSPPHGSLIVGWVGGEAVACAGVKRLEPGVAEIKRMYVAPAWRGRGIASALLAAAEAEASALGYAVVRLDTGPQQAVAAAMYRRHGYREIDDYNGNPDASFWGEKALATRA